MEEALPTSETTIDQITDAGSSGLEGLSRAITAYMSYVGVVESYGNYTYVGYPGWMLHRDAMAADAASFTPSWDYVYDYATCNYIGNYQLQYDFWQYMYSLISKTNAIVKASDTSNSSVLPDLGNALVYRALAYFDLARMLEYQTTGFSALDAKATNIKGLTVPIVTEETTEAEGFNNPRAPFYKMYRFILTDLNKAEKYLANTKTATLKNTATLGVVYGMKARLYLELATRFRLAPDDLSELLSNDSNSSLSSLDKFGLSSATEFYQAAADYARKAINQGYSPLTKEQWTNKTTGFNSSKSNNSWMLAIVRGSSDDAVVNWSWSSWTSWASPETGYGLAGPTYQSARMIGADLFAKIPDADWRKITWIDPADCKRSNSDNKYHGTKAAYESKYADYTNLSYDNWSKLGAYVGFKFRPGSGEYEDYTTANLVDIPLMRVEEMYLIEAEAAAYAQGLASGKSLLEAFLNGYRYTDASYTSSSASLDDFADEILTQRRIELWGEGLISFDYKRLKKAITRGYTGTNYGESYRLNSYEGYVAPWLNFFLTQPETGRNAACLPNPDPSGTYVKWSE
jgi:hypothetical protein